MVADRYYCSYFMIALLQHAAWTPPFACITSAITIFAAAVAWAATTTLWSGNVRIVPLDGRGDLRVHAGNPQGP